MLADGLPKSRNSIHNLDSAVSRLFCKQYALFQRSQMKIPYLVSILTGALLFLIYLFQDQYSDFMYLFSNGFPPLIAGVTVASSILALRKYWGELEDKFSKIWFGFTLGMVFWFLGELGWAIYTLLLNVEIPYPSIADAAWLAGYIPIMAAFHWYVRTFQFTISGRLYKAGAAIIGLGSLGLFAYFLSPVVADMAEAEILTVTIDIAYPALDLALFGYALLALLIFIRGRIALAWALISSAVFMDVVADMLFTYTTLQGTYYSGHPLELLFHFGYIFYALAFHAHRKEF